MAPTRYFSGSPRLLSVFLLLTCSLISPGIVAGVFNYSELPQSNLSRAPHWLSMMERHLTEDQPRTTCLQAGAGGCSLYNWYQFLDSIQHLSPRQKLEQVNRYANKHPYILDINNYGVEDYWAILREFLTLSGDCEDYSLTKYFSLRELGFKAEQMRIVALQDTNLRIAHAVLAVEYRGEILILDNQSEQILRDREILHYAPLYSVNEKQWWMHLPGS